ncbi:lysosomal thioesterase PPT2-A-like isoform X2 [Portunus trituberculatus]|uniref:lysosomal thioesterase PPT2-A-like isoform X2 n=1 Tax=Portunus trituberculatus TaxID=210409 RepID=UPI001E1D0008|nr:lysosomal thioesterase PPT2-A-like isoform X2 [Portunus trituberculatus]
MRLQFFLVLSGILMLTCMAYKPVIIIHGVWDLRFSLNFLAEQIRQYHIGTEVHIIDILHGWRSLAPLWYQVKKFHEQMLPVMQKASDGVILIDDFLRLIFPQYIKETVYEVFYSRIGQRVSVANYWNDPHHQALYYKYSDYLPYLNNEINDSYSKEYRQNFLKLKKLVLIGGPDDGVITPWQSSHFGYFDSEENITEMRDQIFYQQDLFGLHTLDKGGRIKIYEVPGVYHTNWHHNMSVIKNCILPWLD